MFYPRESLRTARARKSLAGNRRESSKRGRVGDQETVVVLKWQRKHDGLPNSKGVALEGDGGREAHRDGLEGDKTAGHLQGADRAGPSQGG